LPPIENTKNIAV